MYFSLVLPVYNRERLLPRCLASLFSQDFGDFEVIAVDDGSTDSSLTVLKAAGDPRLRILSHGKNRGVGPARNTAIAAAQGAWVIPVDSDDELVPGALSRMHRLALETPDSIHALWFRCRMDDGRISPDPVPSAAEWDYRGYIAWLAESRRRWRDMLRCVRTSGLRQVRYPEDRMLEDKFHLDFAQRFNSRFHPDVLRLYHQDADNSLVKYLRTLDPLRDAEFVRDRCEGLGGLLREHGRALAAIAPAVRGDYLRMAAAAALLAGRRSAAFGYGCRLMAAQPLNPAGWKMAAASLVGPALALKLRHILTRT
jgi:glycosyltransferase involved in cell wall biosynthesis